MASSQKIQATEWRSAEKGLITAASDRDLPPGALVESENLIVDEVAGRVIVRDAWDYYPTEYLANLTYRFASLHKVWAVFEWDVPGAPHPPLVIAHTSTYVPGESEDPKEYRLHLAMTPWMDTDGTWKTGSWSTLSSPWDSTTTIYDFGETEPADVQLTRVIYENAVRLFFSWGATGEHASTNPIPHFHLAMHKGMAERFGQSGVASEMIKLEGGAVLAHDSTLVVSHALLTRGGRVDTPRTYRFALEYDGYQVGELSPVYPVEVAGGSAVEITLSVPLAAKYNRRPTGVMVFGASTEGVLSNEIAIGSYALVAKVDFVRGLVDAGGAGSSGAQVRHAHLETELEDVFIAPSALLETKWHAGQRAAYEEYTDTWRGENPVCGFIDQWDSVAWNRRTRVAVIGNTSSPAGVWALPANGHHGGGTLDGGGSIGHIDLAHRRDSEPHAGGKYPSQRFGLPWSGGEGSVFSEEVLYARVPDQISFNHWPGGKWDDTKNHRLATGTLELQPADGSHFQNRTYVNGVPFREVIYLEKASLTGARRLFRKNAKILVIGRDESQGLEDGIGGQSFHFRFWYTKWPGPDNPNEMYPVATISEYEEITREEGGGEVVGIKLGLEYGLADDLDIPDSMFDRTDPEFGPPYLVPIESVEVELIALEINGAPHQTDTDTKFNGCSMLEVYGAGHFPGPDQEYDPDEWALRVAWPGGLVLESDILAVTSSGKRTFFRPDDPAAYAGLNGAAPDFARVIDVAGGGGYRGTEWKTDGTISFVDIASDQELKENLLIHRRYGEFATHGSEIAHVRGATAVRVGDRIFVGDVRVPSPDAPHDQSKDEEVRHQIIYSSYSGGYPATDTFPPANAFSVGQGSARIVAMFEHAGRLVVLTGGTAQIIMVQPGNYANVQYERIFAGLGGYGPGSVARMPMGVAWLASSGVYYLQGAEPQLISAAIGDREFLKMIRDHGSEADLFYGPRRKTLFLSFPTIKPAAYAMSENGAWSKVIFSGYDTPVDFRSGFSSATGEAVAIAEGGIGEPILLASNLDADYDWGPQTVTGRALFPTVQPAGGDRMARVLAVNVEHEPGAAGNVYVYSDGEESNSKLDKIADRTRVPVNKRARNASVKVDLKNPGSYIERVSMEFIPKGRARS